MAWRRLSDIGRCPQLGNGLGETAGDWRSLKLNWSSLHFCRELCRSSAQNGGVEEKAQGKLVGIALTSLFGQNKAARSLIRLIF